MTGFLVCLRGGHNYRSPSSIGRRAFCGDCPRVGGRDVMGFDISEGNYKQWIIIISFAGNALAAGDYPE